MLFWQAHSAAVESTGQAKAEAQSRAEAAKIEGEAAVDQARLKSQALKIEAVSPLFKFLVLDRLYRIIALLLLPMNRRPHCRSFGVIGWSQG